MSEFHRSEIGEEKRARRGLTDDQKPRRLGPKRASNIRKLFGLEKKESTSRLVRLQNAALPGACRTTSGSSWSAVRSRRARRPRLREMLRFVLDGAPTGAEECLFFFPRARRHPRFSA